MVGYIEPGRGAKGQQDGLMMTMISQICISYAHGFTLQLILRDVDLGLHVIVVHLK